MDTTLILIGSGCLVCLMPLAIYLLYLSHLNGRTPPTLVPGPWDLGAVLLGLSGFLLLLGPLLITVADSAWRSYVFGGWAEMQSAGRREARAASLIASGYLIILLSAVAIFLRSRRGVTAVYNVAGPSVEASLVAAIEYLDYRWRKIDGAIEIHSKAATTATVKVRLYPSTGHAVLKWEGDWTGIRPAIETALPDALGVYADLRNPVSGWMFTAALAVMIVMLLWLVVLIYLVVTPTPR